MNIMIYLKNRIMNRKKINICITSDDNYAEHMFITLFSLLFNLNKNCFCVVRIFDSWLNNKSKTLLKSLEKQFKNISINFIHVNVEKYKDFPDFWWTYQTYFRIDIPNLLPNIDKVLYLDPDIVVNKDISNLYETDIAGFAIAAPTESKIDFVYNHILNINVKNWFFNWWVLLCNLNYWRKFWLSDKLKKYLINQEKNYYLDQDALNAVLWDMRFVLPRYYNVTAYQAYRHIFEIKKSVIIHYCWWWDFLWVWKPWLPYSNHPLSSLYHQYRDKTELNHISICENKLKKFYKKILSFWYNYLTVIFPYGSYIFQYIQFKINWKG